MTPRALTNIHTTRNSCRGTLPCANMALKLPQYFYLLMEKPHFVATSKLSLLTIRQQGATRKHLFPYPQDDRSGLRKPNKDKHQHLSQLPPLFISLSQVSTALNNKARFSFNQPNRKRLAGQCKISTPYWFIQALTDLCWTSKLNLKLSF